MSQVLRPYQQQALDDALAFVGDAKPGAKRLYAAPCATGKGTLQLATLRELRARGLCAWLVTPSIEIIRGNLDRLGREVPENAEACATAAFALGITTPVRLLNRLAAGEIEPPQVLLVDEVHSFVDSNSVPDTLFALLADAVWLGYTATPFRATAKGTDALRGIWGEPQWLLRLPGAVQAGHIHAPTISIHPLVDDDAIVIRGGEIDAHVAGEGYQERIDALAALAVTQRDEGRHVCVAVPDTATACMLVQAVERSGAPAAAVLQDTSGAERASVYERVQGPERCVLVQIRVLSVGADLPRLDTLIDAQPTLSPVLWLQTVGRVQRRAEGKSGARLIVTNRNLERHAHLLEGLVPSAKVAEAQEAFGFPSARAGGASALGFEKLNKYKQLAVRLLAGGWLTFYALSAPDPSEEGAYAEFFVAFLPGAHTPLAAKRRIAHVAGERTAYGTPRRSYGKWQRCEVPADLSGFTSSSRREGISEKQRAWWERSARGKGLCPEDAESLAGREFAALPVACDAGFSYHTPREASTSGEVASAAKPATHSLKTLADAFAALVEADW